MKLNCERDDVAWIKAATGPNVGRFVTCLRLIPDQLWINANGTECRLPTWELDSEVIAWDGSRNRFCPDAYLQPISRPGSSGKDARDVLLGERAAA